jgi:DNA-binding HxlR family transcriptional regulator
MPGTDGSEASARAAPLPAPAPGSDAAPAEACATVRDVLTLVGDKWSVLVITLLGGGTRRFMELSRDVEGISQRMLTLTLRRLERDGLVRRTVYPTVPPRVEYALTALGRTLLEPVRSLGRWAAAHRADIDAARRHFDQRT